MTWEMPSTIMLPFWGTMGHVGNYNLSASKTHVVG
jgi:hypothetical protein